MNTSPVAFICVVLCATQVAANVLKPGEGELKQLYAEYIETLKSINQNVRKMYELMSTQKDKDIDNIERKIESSYSETGIRSRRDAPDTSEGLDKIQDALKNFQSGFQSFMKNVTSSDLYKQVQKFGEDLQTKGKELGSKLEETIKNAKDSADKN